MQQTINFCKYAEACRDFTISTDQQCLNGGGTSCRIWRIKTNEEIGGPYLARKLTRKMGY